MKTPIMLALADDEFLFREGLKALFAKETHIDVLFDAPDGNDLVRQLRSATTLPQILLIDLKMPGLNGVEATKIIRQEFPEIRIIALTSYFSKPFIVNMINIGAVAYLAKNSAPKHMIITIEQVAEKGFCYDEQVMQYIHEGLLSPEEKQLKSRFDNTYFTRREKEVLKLICKQYTTREIADALCISPRTVEGHRNNLLLKAGSKNVAGLVIYALRNKVITLEENL